MTLEEALHYIHAVCWKGSIPGLERISALLDKMGHPERTLKFVHVTGTNGKGSTCAMVASVLRPRRRSWRSAGWRNAARRGAPASPPSAGSGQTDPG